MPEGERSLANNDELHRQLLQLAQATGGAYERENVIGDPNQTFGIEIEFDGADANAVAHAFYSAGLASLRTSRVITPTASLESGLSSATAPSTEKSSAPCCVTPPRRGRSWSKPAQSSATTARE